MKKSLIALLFTCLLVSKAEAQVTQCVTNAAAGGTVNAITVPLLPCGLATNLLILTTTGSNTVAGPTLQMVGFPALPIETATGDTLGIGVLPPAGGVVLLTGTGSAWLVLSGGSGGGGAGGSSLQSVTTVLSGSEYDMLATDQFVVIAKTVASTTTVKLPPVSNWPTCGAVPFTCPVVGVKNGNGTVVQAGLVVTTPDGATVDHGATFSVPFDTQEQDFLLTSAGWVLK